MMAERLAEIRSADNPDFVVELIDYIDELRAQLEAQRGEFSHVEASARYKALGLPDDIQMHAIFLEGWNGGVQARRGGAVVVPELTDEDARALINEAGRRICGDQNEASDLDVKLAKDLWATFASRIQPIPAGGALADGMVGVEG